MSPPLFDLRYLTLMCCSDPNAQAGRGETNQWGGEEPIRGRRESVLTQDPNTTVPTEGSSGGMGPHSSCITAIQMSLNSEERQPYSELFDDLVAPPISLGPYLELSLPCRASQLCGGVVCLCDAVNNH